MKPLKFIQIFGILLLAGQISCDFYLPVERIRGDGNVVTEERDVPEFEGIKVSTGVDVYITRGEHKTLEVEADENIQEVLITEVNNGILHVYCSKNVYRAKSLKVFASTETLNNIKISSAGDVECKGTFNADRLDIGLSSAGNLFIDVEANEIDCSISSSGDVDISGSADYLYARLSSAGDLNAYDLKVEDCEISVSSAGSAKIYVTGDLKARASSAGSIYYRGDPGRIDSRSSSAGGIHKR